MRSNSVYRSDQAPPQPCLYCLSTVYLSTCLPVHTCTPTKSRSDCKMFRSICCCFPGLSSPETPEPEPRPEMTESTPRSDANHSNGNSNSNSTTDTDNRNNGYASVVSLPRYTPRPLSIHEKTVDAHLRSPSPSAQSDSMDEKQRFEYDSEGGVTADDGSSAFSFQSSYGNTSTATRETPPPPYSPRMSRSMSLSFSSQRAMPLQPLPLPLPIAQPIAQPPPIYQRPEWIGRSPRCSEEVERAVHHVDEL